MIGIEFTNNFIHMVQTVPGDKKVVVKNVVSRQLNQGIVKNGVIEMMRPLLEITKDMMYEHKIKDKEVSFTIDSTLVKRKRVIVQEHKKLEYTMQFICIELGDMLSEEVHVVDFIPHRKWREKTKDMMEATAYAVPRTIVQTYIDFSKELGLKLKNIDTLANSLEKQIDCDRVIRVNKKEDKTISTQVWTRKVWVGVYYDKINFATRDMEGNITYRTIITNNRMGGERTLEIEKAFLARCVSEILNHINLQTLDQEEAISEVRIYGEYEKMNYLKQLLEECLPMEVTFLRVSPRAKKIDRKQYIKYAPAIGCTITRR